MGTAETVKRPLQQPAQPQYANYWPLLTLKRHILPHPAQPWHTNNWAPRMRKQHQQEPRPKRRQILMQPGQERISILAKTLLRKRSTALLHPYRGAGRQKVRTPGGNLNELWNIILVRALDVTKDTQQGT